MQADHGVALARAAQLFIELGQHFDGDAATGLFGHHAVEQHDAPGADVGRAVEVEGAARERFAHLRNEIVIAGNAQHRFAEAREQAPEMFVAAGVVLHQVAGDQDGIAHGDMARRVSERALQRLVGIHATQRARDVAKQVGVRELDDSDCTHSFELYKHAGEGPVMHVTTWFMAL